MKNEDATKTTVEGFELLCTQARLIAMFPLEEWREAFNRAETVAPILDPTTYREYLYSKKPEIIKDIIDAAIVLKRAVMKHQPTIAAMRERGES